MRFLPFLALLLLQASQPGTGDWPMAGRDAQRSGFTPEELPANLSLRWTHASAHPPMPAWPSSDRLAFDRVSVPIVSGGLVFFGSSADGKLVALDGATGRERWSFFTG